MAHTNPDLITFSDSFDNGGATAWSGGLTDTGSLADFVHYSTLAGISGMPMPFEGAYCMRIIGGGTADAIVTEASIDINTAVTTWVKFNVYFSSDFKTLATADDTIVLFEGTATTAESFACGAIYTASTDSFLWACGTHATTATPDQAGTNQIEGGVWYTIELAMHVVTGSAAGDVNMYVTREGAEPSETAECAETSIQNAAVTEGLFGLQDQAATTGGTILLGGLQYSGAAATSGARIYPTKDRFSTVRQFLRAGPTRDDRGFHAFVGPGTVSNITYVSGGTADGNLYVYDTDTAQAHLGNRKAVMQQVTAGETMDLASVPFEVTRGCYVVLDSDAQELQQVILTISRAPNWFSEGNMRRFGQRRNLSG